MDVSMTLLAQAPSRTYFELSRLQSMTEWWQWLLLLGICLAVAAIIVVMYLYDSVELPRGLTATLVLLRVLAFVGLIVFFLNLEKRTERKLVKNSRALLVVDTSQSMGLQDADSTSVPAAASRIEQVVAELAQGPLIAKLRAKHDVVAYRFDQGAKPVEVASFPKLVTAATPDSASAGSSQRLGSSLRDARMLMLVAGAIFALSLVIGVVYLLMQGAGMGRATSSWALMASVVFLVAALVTLAVADLRNPEVGLLVTLGISDPDKARAGEDKKSDDGTGDETKPAEEDPELRIDWKTALLPRGVETRLGEAIRFLVNKERGGPVAGIVVFTDGGNNAGVEPMAAITAAREAAIPVYTVGLGSIERPANVRVVDLEAPQRVYPGDAFTLTGYLQAYELENRTVKVELVSAPAGSVDTATTFEEERRVTLGPTGEVLPLKFEITPGEQGRRVYKLRVIPPQQDHDERDNEKTATVDVVDRKNRVLLFAGGPSREFQFLRNQLYRDRDTTVDVLLQSGVPGISQEANELLFEFPGTAEELFAYDCIVAFDPDWLDLDELQVDLLDRWVAEKAGGLIVVAGPVFTPQWAGRSRGDHRVDTIKGLYPVVFYGQGSATLRMGRFGGDAAWPLNFTRDGMDAEFLWLGDTSLDSEREWSSFGGVYGYYAVKDPKPGARIYARFSDPDTEIDNELPIYMAGQFYGAGRVFFQASGEMWRLREMDDAYFEQYYTKLIRWASQGRLLQDSSRGLLLVDKDRCLLGDQIAVRAVLTDAQFQPLTAEEVSAVLIQPDSTRATLILRKLKDGGREGMFAAQFTALQEGDYRVEMKVPESPEDELLTRDVRVRVPDLEIERPQRNDSLLKEIADKTGGQYAVGLDAAMNRRGVGTAPLYDLIEPQDQETYLPGTPDKRFEKLLMGWLLGLICGVLCLEWVLRRLNKLA
jgi:hypothetical protein